MSIWDKHRAQQNLLAELPATLQSVVIILDKPPMVYSLILLVNLKYLHMYNYSYISFMYIFRYYANNVVYYCIHSTHVHKVLYM